MIAIRDHTSRIGTRLTTARYLTLPDDGHKYELFHGELVGGPLESATIRSRVVGGFSLRLNKIWQPASEGAPRTPLRC